jgi:hypothetical protein
MVIRTARNLFVLVVCSISFKLVVHAQHKSYSTDSLMAAFDEDSQTSLKGSEITVTGVIVEIKKSRVVFKSLGNDKVICALGSPIAIEGHPVGSSLTVVGKVRGRGMLGNVTLDQCDLASSPAVVAKAVPTKAIPAERAQDQKTLPLADPDGTVSVNAPGVLNEATAPMQPHEIVEVDSNSPKTVSRGVFRACVALLLGIAALLAFVKLRPIIGAGLRPPTFPTTDAMRRSALEALLLKEKSKSRDR